MRPGHLWEQRTSHLTLTFQKSLHDPMGLGSFLSWLTPANELFSLLGRGGQKFSISLAQKDLPSPLFPHSYGTLANPFSKRPLLCTCWAQGSSQQSAQEN